MFLFGNFDISQEVNWAVRAINFFPKLEGEHVPQFPIASDATVHLSYRKTIHPFRHLPTDVTRGTAHPRSKCVFLTGHLIPGSPLNWWLYIEQHWIGFNCTVGVTFLSKRSEGVGGSNKERRGKKEWRNMNRVNPALLEDLSGCRLYLLSMYEIMTL